MGRHTLGDYWNMYLDDWFDPEDPYAMPYTLVDEESSVDDRDYLDDLIELWGEYDEST